MTNEYRFHRVIFILIFFFFFSLQKHVIQQIRIFPGLPWEVQSVERAQGHSRVLLRRLAVPLLHRQKFRQLRFQGASSEIGRGSREQTSCALQNLAPRSRGRIAEEKMG